MFQRQGDDWQAWNAALQRQLLHSQRFDGERRGSWDPDPLWGGYGGRVYSTAMAALCLEVYYRYLPLYGGKADAKEERWTDRPAMRRSAVGKQAERHLQWTWSMNGAKQSQFQQMVHRIWTAAGGGD